MVEIIYENKENLLFFEKALAEITVPYRLNNIQNLKLDLNQPPDDIVFLNRVSPALSDDKEGSAFIKCEQYLDYLAAYNRKVINDHRTVNYEISYIEKIKLFKRHGLAYPQTIFSSEIDELEKMAHSMPMPFILKDNQFVDGYNRAIFENNKNLEEYLYSDNFALIPNGILVLQEYIRTNENKITRVEIINGKFVYAYQIIAEDDKNDVFEYLPDFEHQLIDKYISIAKSSGYDMVGFEFVEAKNKAIYTLDICGASLYNQTIESASGDKAKIAFQELIKEKM